MVPAPASGSPELSSLPSPVTWSRGGPSAPYEPLTHRFCEHKQAAVAAARTALTGERVTLDCTLVPKNLP